MSDRFRVHLSDGRTVEAEHTRSGARARIVGQAWQSARTLSDALRAVGAPTGGALIRESLDRCFEAVGARRAAR